MADDDRYYEGFTQGMRSARGKLQSGAHGRAYWQSEECPTWCTIKHRDGEHYEDRLHIGSDVNVELRIANMTEAGPAHISTYLEMHYREREPRIQINRNGETSLPLGLDEVATLISCLKGLLEEAGHCRNVTDTGLRAIA